MLLLPLFAICRCALRHGYAMFFDAFAAALRRCSFRHAVDYAITPLLPLLMFRARHYAICRCCHD